jgi:hypothetical protein
MLIDYISRRYKFRSNSFGAFGHFVGENKLKIKESNFKLFIGHLAWGHSESVYYDALIFHTIYIQMPPHGLSFTEMYSYVRPDQRCVSRTK